MNTLINNLYILDYILLIIIFLFVFISIWKGFIQSILGLMAWIGSIVITLIFYQKLSNYISEKLNQFEFLESYGLSEIIAIFISIPVIFILSLIILRKLRKIISSDIDKATLGVILDKFFGILYGFFFSYLIFSITLFFIDNINHNFAQFLTNNSQILLQIYLFNESYIMNNLPFLFERSEAIVN